MKQPPRTFNTDSKGEAEMELLVKENGTFNSSSAPNLVLTRKAYTQEEYNKQYPDDVKPNTPLSERIKRKFSRQCLINNLLAYLPIIGFVRTYKPKEYVLGDVLSGLTVGFMALPMALGFGILSGLKPVHGLYTSFFPTVTYMFFGTSPYISFGTNAVMALLTLTVVDREADAFVAERVSANLTEPTEEEILAVKVGSSMACCFIAGLILMGMGLLKLGVITTYLSVSFVGGFTTAAAVHIASSQVPKMFGIKVETFSGAGKLVLMYIDLFKKIETTNVASLLICLVCMAVLLLVKICINERFASKMKMPIPIDLIVVIIGTIISHFANFSDNFDVKVAGEIPSGFQAPALPRLQRAGSFASDAFVMAILSLMMTIAMAKLCAKKHNMPIDDNQELVAYGASNVVSSFFFCFPSATAPPRTMLLSSLGSRSTLSNITTSVFILLVILVVGQLFVSLPLSVLAAMIIISMKELLLQYRNLPRIWKVNKYDFVIWVVTNSVGILVDLNYGIIAGIAISIFLVVLKDQCASGQVVDIANQEDVLVKVSSGEQIKQTPLRGIRIFKIPTSLYFATAERIKSQIYQKVLNPKCLATSGDNEESIDNISIDTLEKNQGEKNATNGKTLPESNDNVHSIILDCSSVSYIDMAGMGVLLLIISEYKQVQIAVYLTGLRDGVSQTLISGDFFKTCDRERVLLDVFDAIAAINKDTHIVARL